MWLLRRVACMLCAALCLLLLGCGERKQPAKAPELVRIEGFRVPISPEAKPEEEAGSGTVDKITLRPVKLVTRNLGFRRPILSPDKLHVALEGRDELATVSIQGGVSKVLVKESDRTITQIAWSPDSKRLLFSAGKYNNGPPIAPGAKGYGFYESMQCSIVNRADRSLLHIGEGSLWAWSPNGRNVAWLPTREPRRLTVSDAKTGRKLTSVVIPWDFTSPTAKTRPLVRPDPKRPETWRGTKPAGNDGMGPWPSPDAGKCVYFTAIPESTQHRCVLGVHGKAGLKEIAELPVPSHPNYAQMRDNTEVIWYPDSRRFLYLTRWRNWDVKMYAVSAKGQVTRVLLDSGESRWLCDFQMLDARHNMVLYRASWYELWIGQLQGVK